MAKNTKRILFCGTQGTGKTTILNMFKERGENVITEVVRRLAKERGIKINREGNDETQKTVFGMYQQVLSENVPYISDRSLIDVYAYTCDGVNRGKISEKIMIDQYEDILNFLEENPDVYVFYFPIEFPVVADGIRSTDEEYRKEIDRLMHKALDDAMVNYWTVSGTPEERFAQICEIIKYPM